MYYTEKYDIIVENLMKEWTISMSDKVSKEKWETPKYSKSEVNKAGKAIVVPTISPEERSAALRIINNWRSSHAYPLQVICSNLRRRFPNAIVVQRLKRLESIAGKIERFSTMNLYRMQDLGGCRVIFDNIEQVYEAINNYKTSRIRHILKNENDYIQEPKKSGYRSYHMVYQFYSDKKETYNKNILIEIQFRTQLQHIWATAVEMMGIYTKSNLKSSNGDDDILRFFVLVSSIFAKMEKTPICPGTTDDDNEIIAEIRAIDKKKQIIQILDHLNEIAEHSKDMRTDDKKEIFYYVLLQNYKKKITNIYTFAANQIELATITYNELEAKIKENENVVLVSASSFAALKAAYPNYFIDISKFVNLMRTLLA